MIGTVTHKERLYLSREENRNVFLNNCELLQQHQIDGLRFLFKQFDKKKPGVIVNYPSRCGKTVLVVLLLQALRNYLDKPVLILCMNDDEILYWKDTLLQWTEYVDEDITIDSSNPYVKMKKVFIKNISELKSYLRRSWSIVIMKNDSISKDIFKITFDADFKIWITSTDMMKDLSMLSFIYTWINPKAVINIEEFKPVNTNIKEKLKKQILLESFLECIILRTNNMKAFISQTKDKEKRQSLKTTRKNKDSTGTKIKRSKTKLIDNACAVLPAINTTGISSTCYNAKSIPPCNRMEEEIHLNLNTEYRFNTRRSRSTSKDIDTSNPNETIKIEPNSYDVENDSQSLMIFNSAIEDLVKCENFNTAQDNVTTINNERADIREEKLSQNKVRSNDNIIVNHGLNNVTDILEVDNGDSLIKDVSFETKDLEKGKDNNLITEIKLNSSNVENFEHNSELNATTSETSSDINIHLSNNRHKAIDAKLQELEESTLKKFKGSILDSIF